MAAQKQTQQLTREQAHGILDEVLPQFNSKEFQRKMRELWDSTPDHFEKVRLRQELCLEIQGPVIAKYGYKPTPAGVSKSSSQIMKLFASDPGLSVKGFLNNWLVSHLEHTEKPQDLEGRHNSEFWLGLTRMGYKVSPTRLCNLSSVTVVVHVGNAAPLAPMPPHHIFGPMIPERCDALTALTDNSTPRQCRSSKERSSRMHPGQDSSQQVAGQPVPPAAPASKWGQRAESDSCCGEGSGGPEAWSTAEWLKEAEARLLQEMQESFEDILAAQEAQECAVRRFFEDLAGHCPDGQHTRESMPDIGGVANFAPLGEREPEPGGPVARMDDEKLMSMEFCSRKMRQTIALRDLRSQSWRLPPKEPKTRAERLFHRFSNFVASLKEPERTGRLVELERSTWFEVLTLVVIMVTVGIVVFETDRDGRIAIRDPTKLNEQKGIRWEFYLEVLCSFFFTAELVLRLVVHKLYFFCNGAWFWDCLDFVSVVVSMVDLAMVSSSNGQAAGASNKYLRFLRGILRMTRMLRVFRSLAYVRALRQILDCIFASLPGIFWSIVLIMFATTITATFLCQCLTTFLEGLPSAQATAMQEDLQILRPAFGTVRSASFSLFEVTSGGEWGEYYRVLCHTGPFAPLALVVYILLFLVVVWNVMTSLFVETMMNLVQPDLDKQLMERRQKDMKDARDLLGLLVALDDEHKGTVCLRKFRVVLGQPSICAFLESRDIDVKDAEMFFQLLQLAVSADELDLETVVHGLMRMRGVATNMDLQALQFQMQMHNSFQIQSLAHTKHQLHALTAKIQGLFESKASAQGRRTRAPTTLMV